MEFSQITLFAISTVVAIIGYFLKLVHSDVRRTTEELGKLKGKIELVDQENRLKYQGIQEITQHELKNMAQKIGDLSGQWDRLTSGRSKHDLVPNPTASNYGAAKFSAKYYEVAIAELDCDKVDQGELVRQTIF